MNPFIALRDYLVTSYAEMKKVTWPSRQQTINYSAIVIGLSVGIALFLGLLDFVFNLGITSILR